MFVGDIVFKRGVSARLTKYTMAMLIDKDPIIVYSYSLTTELAFFVLNNPVVGIITEESSFATHGANILRCHQNKSNRKIAWISGINIKKLSEFDGRIVSMHEDGWISFDDEAVLHNPNKQVGRFYPYPMKKRCIVEYDLTSSHYKLCYWPHRCFNQLTYSIWKSGLEKNLRLFGKNNPMIKMDNGRIWFYDCPFLSDYIRIATDYVSATRMLDKQIELYHSFYLRLINEDYSCSELIKMLCDFFSVFLLFHDTYEDVLLQAYCFFENNIDNDVCYGVFNKLLQSKIDKWMLSENLLLIKRKNFLSDEPIVPIPPFTIYSDIDETIHIFMEYLAKIGFAECCDRSFEQIVFYNKCFVAKEWKFVMIKILSTRFSSMLRERLPEKSFDDISKMNIDELNKLLV